MAFGQTKSSGTHCVLVARVDCGNPVLAKTQRADFLPVAGTETWKNSMQMVSLWMRCVLIILAVLVAQSALAAGSGKTTLVEVWSGGDDSLTTGLRNVLENAFKSSHDFVLSSGKKPGTLITTIPTHVEWKRAGKRTKVFYTVRFTSVDDQLLGISKGSCWDNAMTKCASQIVKDATTVAHKVHQD